MYQNSHTQSSIFPILAVDKIGSMKTPFGLRIYEAMQHADMNQSELSKKIGLSQGGISALIKTGQGSSYTPAIAQALGVNVNWLAYGNGAMLDAAPKSTIAGVSDQALQLAALFDLIPIRETLQRQKAYAAAVQSILSVLQP
jgi:transcriptional regulator with XRE-family HTH domain